MNKNTHTQKKTYYQSHPAERGQNKSIQAKKKQNQKPLQESWNNQPEPTKTLVCFCCFLQPKNFFYPTSTITNPSPSSSDVWHVIRRLEVDLIHYDSAAHKGNCKARYNVAPQSGSPYLSRWRKNWWDKKPWWRRVKTRLEDRLLVGCNWRRYFCLGKKEVWVRKPCFLVGCFWQNLMSGRQKETLNLKFKWNWPWFTGCQNKIRFWSNDLNLGMCDIATIQWGPWPFSKFTKRNDITLGKNKFHIDYSHVVSIKHLASMISWFALQKKWLKVWFKWWTIRMKR